MRYWKVLWWNMSKRKLAVTSIRIEKDQANGLDIWEIFYHHTLKLIFKFNKNTHFLYLFSATALENANESVPKPTVPFVVDCLRDGTDMINYYYAFDENQFVEKYNRQLELVNSLNL